MRNLATSFLAVLLAFVLGLACGLLWPRAPVVEGPVVMGNDIALATPPVVMRQVAPGRIDAQVEPTPTHPFANPSVAMREQIAREAWKYVGKTMPPFDEIKTDQLFKFAYVFNFGAPITPIFPARIGSELWWGQGYSEAIVVWKEGDPEGYCGVVEWSGASGPGVYNP